MEIEDRGGFWDVLGVVARLGPIRKTAIEKEVQRENPKTTITKIRYLLKSRKGRNDKDMVKCGLLKYENKEYSVTLCGFLRLINHVSDDEAVLNFYKRYPHSFSRLMARLDGSHWVSLGAIDYIKKPDMAKARAEIEQMQGCDARMTLGEMRDIIYYCTC
jgi:glutamine synthetase adenylyltransferase